MYLLQESFAMFTYAGVWLPIYWSPRGVKSILYRIYTLISVSLVYSLTISELAGAILLTKNLEDFTDISFLLISTISVCCKINSIILRREQVIGLAEMMLDSKCLPRNAREIKLLESFNKITRYTALSCFTLAEMTVTVMSVGPILFGNANRTLPFKSWLPYDISSNSVYWLSYLHQTVAIVACATINVANDSLICGFMVQACSQLELLNRRMIDLSRFEQATVLGKKFKNVAKNLETRIISMHIRHHIHIFKFAEKINSIFTPVILVQFCMSSIVLSLSVYQLSIRSANQIQFVIMVLYLSCMLVQFFMYCWFGNEVTLKSIDFGEAIYKIDWINLRLQSNKNLMIMMLRTRRPIVMSCGSLITLSIKSFTSILKTSYSAFNVLQRSSNKSF